MTSVLCLTLRFLDPVPQFHGRGDDGDPEWPPSPLRLFQALVAAAATRWREDQFRDYAQPALQWLEAIPPFVVTPRVLPESFGYRMYVPNNSGDLMTAAWARGDTETSMAKFRVEKDVRPTHLRGGDAVHYLYVLPDGSCPHFEVLAAAARSITHLGWGVDMVAGNATLLSEEDAAKLPGERWQPVDEAAGNGLRVPKDGTLADLSRKHKDFLGRLAGDGFKPVPPLREFDVKSYRRPSDSPSRPFVAFTILDAEASKPRSFDTPRHTRNVAAWVRSVTGDVCQEWPDVASFVHGHDEVGNQLKGDDADRRFLYLPLPTVNHGLNRVESIRRVLIAAPIGHQDRIDWIRRRLPGQDLVYDNKVKGMLNLLPTSDWVLRQYTGSSATWSTVTPVILPGHDDGNGKKAEGILRKAFTHAGVNGEILSLDWRDVGFRAGVDLAGRYDRPDKLTGRAFHVRVEFREPVRGPLAIGAGRYRGFGLFVAE